jgi:hypothetical protein
MRTAAVLTLCSIAAIASTESGFVRSLRAQAPAAEATRTFRGTWSATGQRQSLPTETGQPAAVVRISGAVLLEDASGLSNGFRGEAIGFDDGRMLSVGRAVWTDSRGDRIFSELKGEPLQTGRRVFGTITGGTGRYDGATGDYELTWQYVVSAEGDTVQGRATNLRGQIRVEGRR